MNQMLELFPTPKQPRRSRREGLNFYEAVLSLRRAGFKVYRAGRCHHMAAGIRLDDQSLIRFADAEGKPKQLFEGRGELPSD